MAFMDRDRGERSDRGDRGDRGERGERGDRGDREIKRKYRSIDELSKLDLRDRATIERFMTEHGKILPIRLTGANSKYQRRIKNAIKQARSGQIK